MSSRLASVAIGIVAMGLGIVFEKQNVAYMVGLAFAVAASANFPVLLLNMYWRRFSTAGAVLGGSAGLVSRRAADGAQPGDLGKGVRLFRRHFSLMTAQLCSRCRSAFLVA